MKHVFVRFEERHDDEWIGCILLVSGKAAESWEAFEHWHNSGAPMRILDWFEIPESWKNTVASGEVNDTFEAILHLDGLAETPVVSDLLATIFETGYSLAAKKRGG